MNPLLLIFALPLSLVSAANYSRRLCRTLSATTKKPAPMAGLFYLILSTTRLTLFSLPQAALSRTPRSLPSTIQTPNSL